jgi:hypothetical protein
MHEPRFPYFSYMNIYTMHEQQQRGNLLLLHVIFLWYMWIFIYLFILLFLMFLFLFL